MQRGNTSRTRAHWWYQNVALSNMLGGRSRMLVSVSVCGYTRCWLSVVLVSILGVGCETTWTTYDEHKHMFDIILFCNNAVRAPSVNHFSHHHPPI